MRTRFSPTVVLALLPMACAQPTPCSGSGCLPISGNYTFVLGSPITCAIWERTVPPSSLMQVVQSGSSLNVTLWPVTDDPHFLTGTLNADGSIQATESQQNVILGIPYATLTGVFSGNEGTTQPPFYFSGQIYLQGGSSGTSGVDAGVCSGATTLTAEQQGVTAPGAPDAGNGDAGCDGGC